MEHSNIKKQVLYVASSYPESNKDWKSVFISQLLHALSESVGYDFSYWGPTGELPQNVSCACLTNEEEWLALLMRQGGVIHLVRQKKLLGVYSSLKLLFMLYTMYHREDKVDLYHINWLQNIVTLPHNSKPLVVSVLGSDFGLMKIPGMKILIRIIFKNRKSIICPNASWMVPDLKEWFGDLAEVIEIPLGINDAWFNVQHNQEIHARNRWLVTSRLTIKKIGDLFTWGESCFASPQDELHLFGPMQEELHIPDWVRYHGSTTPDLLATRWFPNAAGLITLSRHDEGRPQIMLEAMAAKVPVIASDISAHRDFIKHEKNGILVSSAEELKYYIDWLKAKENHLTITNNAFDWINNNIGNWQTCATRYFNLYSKIIES